ncbi:MAG: fibronectin type III domain-containing protein, partial [Kiritimatiellae bacterium]|nr:fibronectin type III domain-containing protein [Kiritimatiellia bacterium]
SAATGVTTGTFSIAWSGVTGATGYTVQVAESAMFDEGVATSASFEDGALPAGWATNKVTFSTAKANFSGDGKGVAVFAGSGHWLMTPKLAHPGLVGWSHAKNTGSAAGTAWSYVVECSSAADFATVVFSETVTVDDAVTTPTMEGVDLTGLQNVYVRWRDTRASGTAQRYLSEIIAWDGVTTNVSTGATSASFGGLEAGTVYYVRVRASTATGASDWSATQTVTTADPPAPPAAPVLGNAAGVTENGFTIGWNAPSGAQVFHLQVSDVATFDDEPILAGDFSGDLPVGWETTAVLTNSTTYAHDGGSAVVFKGAGKILRTPMVANPATLTWYHGTTSTNEWSYRLEASPTTDFSTPIPIQSVTVTQKLATAVKMTANLRGQKNVYLRWVDTRPSGTAQRFISGISLTGLPVLDLNGWTTTSRNVTGLSAGTAYYVRVMAWGEGGWSDWSAVKSVTTGGGAFDPATWEVGAEFENGKIKLDWAEVPGVNGYVVEFSTNLMSGVWETTNSTEGVTIELDNNCDEPI